MSDNAYGTGLARRIREWDDYVEDHDREQATKPFDGGVMLAVATFFAAWDEEGLPATPRIEQAVKNLRETVEQVIER